MLGKLFKYEIKATSRFFVPLYLTILAFAIINRFFLPLRNIGESIGPLYGITVGISMFIYGILIVGLIVMTLFVMIQRFHKNLLGDEGYLMFTLPVQSWKHIVSKLSASMLWTIASGIVAFCSIFIIAFDKNYFPEFFEKLSMAFSQFTQNFGASSYLITLEVIVLGLITLASTILTVYTAIALGHLFSKHKLLASFAMYILIKIVSETIMSISAMIFFNHDIFRPGSAFIPTIPLVNSMLFLSLLYFGAFAAGYFALTNHILKRKLNLE